VRSDRERAESFLDSLNEQQQVGFLARLSYELTLVGRYTYLPEFDEEEHPDWLRELNERQHWISSLTMKSTGPNADRAPLSILAKSFLSPDVRDVFLHMKSGEPSSRRCQISPQGNQTEENMTLGRMAPVIPRLGDGTSKQSSEASRTP